jgi:DNA-directed RNA polymerase II subunit RPB2
MYNGQTGEQYRAMIFCNPKYYQRLKHMVDDKYHSRESGPIQTLTRQPAEGRSRDGGLRIGEMERDCYVGHGLGRYQKEKMVDSSDLFQINISKQRQVPVTVNPQTGVYKYGREDIYEEDDIVKVEVPFAFNLFRDELTSMMIGTKMTTE